MNMKKSLFCLSLALFILVVQTTTTCFFDDLVDETCKNTPNFELCASTLRSDPKSKGADVSALGLIIVYRVKSEAASTLQGINALMETNQKLRAPLEECVAYYDAILNADVPSSIQALRLGDAKFAESGMADAADEASFCEQAFDKEGDSPLTSANKLVADLSLVASAIAKLLL